MKLCHKLVTTIHLPTGPISLASVSTLGQSLLTLAHVKRATLTKAVRRRGRVDDIFALLSGLFVQLEAERDRKLAEGFERDEEEELANGWVVGHIRKTSGVTRLDGFLGWKCET